MFSGGEGRGEELTKRRDAASSRERAALMNNTNINVGTVTAVMVPAVSRLHARRVTETTCNVVQRTWDVQVSGVSMSGVSLVTIEQLFFMFRSCVFTWLVRHSNRPLENALRSLVRRLLPAMKSSRILNSCLNFSCGKQRQPSWRYAGCTGRCVFYRYYPHGRIERRIAESAGEGKG